jgi:Ca2+-transporting ATPase
MQQQNSNQITSDQITGISEQQAQEIIKQNGYNELANQKPRNVFWLLIAVLQEPMLLMILACGTIYLLLGEMRDALMLLTFIIVVIAITFYQERRTERSLLALKNLSSPRALVIRDAVQKRIAGREVAVGDIIILREGDRIPADCLVIMANNLMVDQSLLTGESMAVQKFCYDQSLTAEQINSANQSQIESLKSEIKSNNNLSAENEYLVFSGSLVISGNAIVKAIFTGQNTEIGKIGKSLAEITPENTLLQKETAKIIAKFAIAGVILCLSVVLVYGLNKGNWSQGFLSGLTLGMAMLPEEFSMVLVVFLALGAWRISKRNVLTRKASAIEALGAIDVLCVDKTGTLTLNQMKLEGLMVDDYYDLKKHQNEELPEDYHLLLEYGILASQTDPFDPIEKEIKDRGESLLFGTEHIHDNWQLVREYPLSKELLALSHVWRSPDDHQCYVVAAKGAPEAIADLCHFNQEQTTELMAKIAKMSDLGLRILGVAKASFCETDLPGKQHDFHFEFVGLIGFSDPIRDNIKTSIEECYNAGIRVVMITGDYAGTACNIAKKIGLNNPAKYLTGPEVENLSADELSKKIKSVNIFARISPKQKLLLVNAFKADNKIVAIAGDGVNDAPAIKAANIGIAMGKKGTDVAREASDLVLLDDDFTSIIQAIKLGRRIFDNLKKSFSFIFAVHIPIAAMSLIPVIFNLPIILLPAHIAFLELIIDPACSLVFESQKEEKNIMNRPPRHLQDLLFSKKDFIFSAIQGLIMLVVVCLIFLFALRFSSDENYIRTMSFAAITFASMMLIISNLSGSNSLIQILKSQNIALLFLILGVLIALMIVIYLPFFSTLFHFTKLSLKDLSLAFSLPMIGMFFIELVKFSISGLPRRLRF